VSLIAQYIEDKEFNPETKLSELFNGKPAKLLEEHFIAFLDLIAKKISEQKPALIKEIQSAMPWYAAPAYDDVPPIVALLIDVELPKFLKRKQENILGIANSLLEYPLAELNFGNKVLNAAALEQLVADVLNAPRAQESISSFVQAFAESYAKAPLKDALAVLNINSIHDLTSLAEPLLTPALSYIKFRLLQDDVSAHLAASIKQLAVKISDGISVSGLLAQIDLEREMQKLFELLFHDKNFASEISDTLLNVLSDTAKNSDVYNDALLRKDIARFIAEIREDEWEVFARACMPAMKTFFQRLNKTLAPETKRALCNEYLIPATLDAAENHFSDLINSIDVQKVVEREVNAMHPKSIEKLFYKFAGKYFAKIIMYGWIGVFGGLLSYIIGSLLKMR
jgi:hypothetical protein